MGGEMWGHAIRRRRTNTCELRRNPKRKMLGRSRRRQPVPELLRPPIVDQGHCLLPLEYDFFADYKAIRTHVWYETSERNSTTDDEDAMAANVSDVMWAVRQYLSGYNALGKDGVKILHWP